MNVTVDTNLLVRGALRDNQAQAVAAAHLLTTAALIAIPLPCLCEFVWVMRRTYKLSREEVSYAIEALLHTPNVVVNQPAVEAGLSMLRRGGDFADGVIAFEGRWMGGDTFVSFDRKAVAELHAQGHAARLLS